MDTSEALANLVAITGADEAQALSLLQATDFQLDQVHLPPVIRGPAVARRGRRPMGTAHCRPSRRRRQPAGPPPAPRAAPRAAPIATSCHASTCHACAAQAVDLFFASGGAEGGSFGAGGGSGGAGGGFGGGGRGLPHLDQDDEALARRLQA